MARPIWRTPIERDAWVEKHCAKCFQPDEAIFRVTGRGTGCPFRLRGDAGRLPPVWKFRRNAVMGDTYTCTEFRKEPPVVRRATANDATVPMFDIEPTPNILVPVEGWPDHRPKRTKDVDHQ
jgi:hypothetical protein